MKPLKPLFVLILTVWVLAINPLSLHANGSPSDLQSENLQNNSNSLPTTRDHQQRQPNEQATKSQAVPYSATKSFALITQPQTKKEQSSTDNNSEDSYYDWFWPPIWSNWALVLVAVVAAYVALRTLNTIKEQTKAANNTAKAAIRQSEALILAERAYINISHESHGLIFKTNETRQWCEAKLHIENCGKTPARIADIRIGIKRYESFADLPESPDYQFPPSEKSPCHAFLVPTNRFTWDYISPGWNIHTLNSQEGSPVLCLLGYADYIDMFGQRHRFHYARRYLPQTGNNLIFITNPGYNDDRPRQHGEGNDWT